MDRQYEGLRQHSRQANELVKECLKTALLELAADKDYKEVAVTELCRKAGVSRMAFYRNYSIVSDVFFEIASDLNQDLIAVIGSPFRQKTTREWYRKAFEIIGRRKDTMKLMFEENFQYQWMRTVNGFAVHDETFSAEKKYQRLMWSGGFENAVSYWLNSGLKESPEEMADYCFTYLPHLLAEDEQPSAAPESSLSG